MALYFHDKFYTGKFAKKAFDREKWVEYDRLAEIQSFLKINQKKMAALLQITPTQLSSYKRNGLVLRERFINVRDALLMAIEDDARNKREKILYLFRPQDK